MRKIQLLLGITGFFTVVSVTTGHRGALQFFGSATIILALVYVVALFMPTAERPPLLRTGNEDTIPPGASDPLPPVRPVIYDRRLSLGRDNPGMRTAVRGILCGLETAQPDLIDGKSASQVRYEMALLERLFQLGYFMSASLARDLESVEGPAFDLEAFARAAAAVETYIESYRYRG